MAGPDVICVSSSGAAQVVLKRIEREARYLCDIIFSFLMFINGEVCHFSEIYLHRVERNFYLLHPFMNLAV
jgi:hypothetical protein